MAGVTLDQVSKVYPDGYKAVNGIDLAIADGEFMVLVGPSGCGKTTALRMVAGLESISGGTRPDRRPRRQLRPLARPRHRDGLPELRALPAPERLRQHRVRPAAEEAAEGGDRRPASRRRRRTLGLEDQLKRKPRNLSGGQRQRVAMGRAIVREPAAFLMDEPLSNLDAKLRVQMRAEISRLQRDLGVTTIYVTHDQVEAMTMGDRVAVMRKGEIQQVDEPQTLYDHPVNLFVGGFIGSPAMNMVDATVERSNGTRRRGARRAEARGRPRQPDRARPALASYDGRPGDPRDPAGAPRGRGARRRGAARRGASAGTSSSARRSARS